MNTEKIFSECWAMPRTDYLSLCSILIPALQSGRVEEVERLLSSGSGNMYAASGNPSEEWELDDPSLPKGSVAVLPMNGTLYPWNTSYYTDCVEAAAGNDSIDGLVLRLNGPGGMVGGVSSLHRALKECGKPVVALIEGGCMSAHYWIASAAGRRLLVSKACECGSIGVMGIYTDPTKMFEKEGIDYREIYPDTADLKNREVRDIREKNSETLYKKKLAQMHALFCEDVARGTGLAYDPESPVFRGDTFLGDEAIAAGLADGYGTLSDAIGWVNTQKVVREANASV